MNCTACKNIENLRDWVDIKFIDNKNSSFKWVLKNI